jgi:hypothetical protein
MPAGCQWVLATGLITRTYAVIFSSHWWTLCLLYASAFVKNGTGHSNTESLFYVAKIVSFHVGSPRVLT